MRGDGYYAQFGFDLDDDARVEEGLRIENRGVTTQRIQAIKRRWPERNRLSFAFAGGVPVRAHVGDVLGARV